MKSKILYFLLLVILGGLFLFLPSFVFAENGGDSSSPESQPRERPQIPSLLLRPSRLGGPSQPAIGKSGVTGGEFKDYLTGFAARYFAPFLAFIAISAVVVIIISGIMFLTAFGNEERLGQAKKIAQWAIIGLVLAMLSYAIVRIILELPFGT